MRPPPVLSEGEENVLFKWITGCSRKGCPQRKMGVQLSVEEFLTLNHRRVLSYPVLPNRIQHRSISIIDFSRLKIF
jgi:hypothetical protein